MAICRPYSQTRLLSGQHGSRNLYDPVRSWPAGGDAPSPQRRASCARRADHVCDGNGESLRAMPSHTWGVISQCAVVAPSYLYMSSFCRATRQRGQTQRSVVGEHNNFCSSGFCLFLHVPADLHTCARVSSLFDPASWLFRIQAAFTMCPLRTDTSFQYWSKLGLNGKMIGHELSRKRKGGLSAMCSSVLLPRLIRLSSSHCI